VVGQNSASDGTPRQTIEFFADSAMTTTTSVSNIVMPIFSIGNGSLEGRWVFDEQIVVISANTATKFDKTSDGRDRLSAKEGHAVIQFLGTFDQISFEVEAPEYWAGWNMGATNVAPPASELTASRVVVTGETGLEIAPVEFTATTSVTGTQTFELTGNLPAGLSFSTTNGAITGTPTEVTNSANVVVTVKDPLWGDASVTITFTFTAPQPPPPPPPPTTTTTTTTPPPSTVPQPVPVGGVLPNQPPGQSQVLVDGVPVSVEVFVEASTDLVMKGQDFELRLAGECSAGCSITTTADGRQVLELEERGLAKVSGAGFLAGTPVYVWLFSEPRFLGELTVNADGTFSGNVPLGDIAPGEHTLQVNGISFDGLPRTANLGVVVNALPTPTTLPATGSDPLGLWVLALALFGLGLTLTVRRKPHPTF
jgi:hypothetical protein